MIVVRFWAVSDCCFDASKIMMVVVANLGIQIGILGLDTRVLVVAFLCCCLCCVFSQYKFLFCVFVLSPLRVTPIPCFLPVYVFILYFCECSFYTL